MMPTLAVARSTVREAVRERIVLALVLFGVALVAGSLVLSPLALGEGRKIVLDFGLAGSSIVSILLAVFLGTSLLHKELERRSLYSVLTKPIRRQEYLIGKFLGLWVTTALLLAGMTGIVFGVVTLAYRETPWQALGSLHLSVIELGIVTALVVLFSSFTTPALTALFAIAGVLTGHFAEDLRAFVSEGAAPIVARLTEAVYWAVPHLGVFNVRGLISHGIPIGADRLAFATAYGLLYIAGTLALAGTIFRQREFR